MLSIPSTWFTKQLVYPAPGFPNSWFIQYLVSQTAGLSGTWVAKHLVYPPYCFSGAYSSTISKFIKCLLFPARGLAFV
jgi:hypothetical protein